jgi:hypothetical protein
MGCKVSKEHIVTKVVTFSNRQLWENTYDIFDDYDRKYITLGEGHWRFSIKKNGEVYDWGEYVYKGKNFEKFKRYNKKLQDKLKIKFPGIEYTIIYNGNVLEAVETIERYWLKSRWKFRRKRIDSLKRDLMEYLYHPSRMSFQI